MKTKKSLAVQGFMAERLRKQSVLNANLFRKENVDYKEKVSTMVKKLNSVLNGEKKD